MVTAQSTQMREHLPLRVWSCIPAMQKTIGRMAYVEELRTFIGKAASQTRALACEPTLKRKVPARRQAVS